MKTIIENNLGMKNYLSHFHIKERLYTKDKVYTLIKRGSCSGGHITLEDKIIRRDWYGTLNEYVKQKKKSITLLTLQGNLEIHEIPYNTNRKKVISLAKKVLEKEMRITIDELQLLGYYTSCEYHKIEGIELIGKFDYEICI